MKPKLSPGHIQVKVGEQVHEFELDATESVAVIVMDAYEKWVDSLAEPRTRARIDRDVGKMRRGLFGDWKEIDGIFEMRMDHGPGYRVYYGKHGSLIVILLGGGDKKSQPSDMARARKLWEKIKNEIKTL